jgi:hypothetical protein
MCESELEFSVFPSTKPRSQGPVVVGPVPAQQGRQDDIYIHIYCMARFQAHRHQNRLVAAVFTPTREKERESETLALSERAKERKTEREREGVRVLASTRTGDVTSDLSDGTNFKLSRSPSTTRSAVTRPGHIRALTSLVD